MRKVFVEPVVLPEPRFRDGLGIRYVRTAGSDDPVEVLRPLWELAAIRTSIQNRVDRLVTFRQARFVPVRRAEVPPDDASTIEVVSDFVSGNRLSDILEAAKTGAVIVETRAALQVVRELLGAISVLHESRGVTHGAIAPERILITPRGRVVVADYVLGSAIERLEYTRSRLWREFRIPILPGKGRARFDEFADVMQIGVLALALLAGRPIDGDEYPKQLSSLVEAIGITGGREGRQPVPKTLLVWLKRMLPHEENARFATVREARMALETVLSKLRQAAAGADALKALAEAFQGQLTAVNAARGPATGALDPPPVIDIAPDLVSQRVVTPLPNTGPLGSGTELVPALTVLPEYPPDTSVEVESVSGGLAVAQAFVVPADPPVGWHLPETDRVEEPVVAGPLLQMEPPAVAPDPGSDFVEEVLDLGELAEDEPADVVTPADSGRLEEACVAAPLPQPQPPAVAPVADSYFIEALHDLLELREEECLSGIVPPDGRHVEEAVGQPAGEPVEKPVWEPVGEPVITGLVPRDEPHTVELRPESRSVEDILDLLEGRRDEPSAAASSAARSRAGEPVFTSQLSPTDPPVGWRVPAYRRVDEGKAEARLFGESTRGGEDGGAAAPADRGSSVPPTSIEPAFVGAALPPDWFIDVEAARIDGGGMPMLESGTEPWPSQSEETKPVGSVRLEPPEPTAVVAQADTTLTQAYDDQPAPVPSQPVFRAAEHVVDAEPVVARVAPSVQRVRAAAARRRLPRVRTGVAQIAEASGGALLAGLAGIGSACSSVAGGTARALAGLAQGLGGAARAAGASGVDMLALVARAFDAAARGGGAVAVLLLSAVGRSFIATARAGRVGSAWVLAALARAVRVSARATGAAGAAMLSLLARGIRITALSVLAVGGILLRTSAWTGAAAARGGRAVCLAAVAGLVWSLRAIASAGRAGAAPVLVASTWAIRSARSARAARGTVRSPAASGAATVPVVMRRCRSTPRAGRTVGAGAWAVPRRLFFFAADLAERIPRRVVRPWYLAAALLVIAAVAGVPLAKARWLSLGPQTGNLRVESVRPGLTVRIDGLARGTTPLSTAVAIGRHRIEVDGGGRTRSQDVVVTAGQNTVVQLSGGATRGAGTLRLTSDPAGAEVWLDGVLHGTAPLTIENVAEGSHTVVVREAGGSVRQTVRVRADETVDATIPIRPGWLAVFAALRLDIVEDGRVIGTTEGGRILVKPGGHTLELVGDSIGFRETRKVEVKPGEVAALTIELPTATLEIVAPADAEILIDGQLIGKAPLEPVAVAAGTREVSMRHPTLGEQRQMTTITYRTPNRVVFEPRN